MNMFKVIVAGGRDFSDYDLLKSKLDNLLVDRDPVEIVSGTARGADKLGEFYAKRTQLAVALFPANWDLYGKSAGYRRNEEMAEYADALVAFWDGKSRGTKHMIDLANKSGIQVRVVNY
jgi:hypothetical protein